MKLDIKNLTGGYGKNTVLDNVTFTAESGDMIYVLGPNGGGKTTMFSMIIGYKKRMSGDILLDGIDIETFSDVELAKNIAYIPQDHVPAFNYTVEDVVLMGRTCHLKRFAVPQKDDYDIVHETLEKLGIESFAQREYMELSGGERQLALIARALCQKAKIIIMDEPLTGLDFANKAMVTSALKDLVKSGYTIIMSTHNAINNYSDDDKILLINAKGSGVFGNINHMIKENIIQKAYNIPLQTICSMDKNGGRHLLCLPI